jgi:hypothetical protein
MSDPELTAADIQAIKFFAAYVGDLQHWPAWPQKKAAVERRYPQLMGALARVRRAEQALRKIVEAMDQEAHET